MIVVLYDPPRYARFFPGVTTAVPLQVSKTNDQYHSGAIHANGRSIQSARVVQPPLTGTGYCLDCWRRFESEELGTFHHGHLVDIHSLQFNTTEANRD